MRQFLATRRALQPAATVGNVHQAITPNALCAIGNGRYSQSKTARACGMSNVTFSRFLRRKRDTHPFARPDLDPDW